jgi:hypothetical protein
MNRQLPFATAQFSDHNAGMIRFMKPSNRGTVKAVSPWAGPAHGWFADRVWRLSRPAATRLL